MAPKADENPRQPRGPHQLWVAIISVVVGMGVPAVLWGGRIDSRMENVEAQQRSLRTETREDLREINRKLDAISERLK